MEQFLLHIEKGDIQSLRQELSAGKDPNELSRYGATPLGVAARYGQIQAVELLVQMGADINKVDGQGWTPLMNAVSSNNARTVKALLGLNARTDILNHAGQTVHDMVALQKDPSAEVVALLSKRA